MNEDERSVRLWITGRVQGVGYRDWVVDTAQALRLRGWVRNRRDGSVEVLVAGAAALVEQLVEACRRGPRSARVANVEAVPADEPIPERGFGRRPTA